MSSRDLANLKNGLVAAWIPSLGSTGYRLVDRVGSNHGVLTNMDASDWVVSGGNLSLDFDGSNDHITTGFAGVNTQTRSVSCWFKTSQFLTSGQYMAIVGWGLGSIGGACYVAIGVAGSWDGFGVSQFGDDVSVANVTDGTWKHGCIVNTGTTWHVYVNGVLGATKTMTTTPASGQTVIIGQWPFASPLSSNANFLGQLDDIRIYNRPLSPNEIRLLASERGIGFKRTARSAFAEPISYKPPKDKTYAAITRSQSDYDSLREGLVLAICPSVSGATGFRAPDLSGRGNHGSLVNMDAATDWVVSNGVALDFDGSNDSININLQRPLTHTDKQSFSAYINTTAIGSQQTVLATWKYLVQSGLQIVITSSGLVSVGWIDGGASNYYITETTSAITANRWTSIAVITTDGTASGVQIWVDGKQVSVTTTIVGTGNPGTGDSKELWIGRRQSGAGDTPFSGKIDDVRIYSRALTVPEIRRLASGRGVGLKPTSTQFDYLETREKTYGVIVKSQQEHSSLSEGLVGAWCPSLGATGYRLIDRSGYGNHGTLTNMTSDDWVVSGGAGALDFDGSDDWVAISDTRQWHKSDFSFACFANFRSNGESNYGTVFSRDNGGSNWVFFSRDAQSFSGKMSVNFYDGSNNPSVQSNTDLNLSTWYHVAFTVLGNTATVYVNGKSEASASIASWTRPTINDIQLGRWNLTGGRTMDGAIDDAKLYARALTPAEIRQLASKRGIGLQPRPKQFTFYQFPSGSKRRRLLTGMP